MQKRLRRLGKRVVLRLANVTAAWAIEGWKALCAVAVRERGILQRAGLSLVCRHVGRAVAAWCCVVEERREMRRVCVGTSFVHCTMKNAEMYVYP